MVALSGTGWRLAPALKILMAETDRLFPARSTASDGSIGDLSHSARTSDHNPDEGWVDAVDITDDDAHGCDVGLLAHHLVASKDRRVSYLIHKGTIWRGYDKPGLPAFTPQVYTGINAHAHHLHVSVADEFRNDTGSWWPQSQPKPPIATEEDDLNKEQDAALAEILGLVRVSLKGPSSTIAKLKADVAALGSAVSQLGAGGTVDYARVQEAAEAAVEAVLKEGLG